MATKKIILFFSLIVVFANLFAQNNNKNVQNLSGFYFSKAMHGDSAFHKYLRNHLFYPDEVMNQTGGASFLAAFYVNGKNILDSAVVVSKNSNSIFKNCFLEDIKHRMKIADTWKSNKPTIILIPVIYLSALNTSTDDDKLIMSSTYGVQYSCNNNSCVYLSPIIIRGHKVIY